MRMRLEIWTNFTSSFAYRKPSLNLSAMTSKHDSITSQKLRSSTTQSRATELLISSLQLRPTLRCVRCTRRRRCHSYVACVSCSKRELLSSPALRTPTGRREWPSRWRLCNATPSSGINRTCSSIAAHFANLRLFGLYWLHTVRSGRLDSTIRGARVATALTSESDQIARRFSAARCSNCKAILERHISSEPSAHCWFG